MSKYISAGEQQSSTTKNLTKASCSQRMTILPEGFEPGENDVICGRGKKCYNHEGNERFRQRVKAMLEEYSKAKSKLDKSGVLSSVVDQVRRASPDGGFVKQDQSGRWYEVGDFLAREKTSQAFRDALHEQYKSSNIAKKKRRQEEQAKASANLKKMARSEFEISTRLEQLSQEILSDRGSDDQVNEVSSQSDTDLMARLTRVSGVQQDPCPSFASANSAFGYPSSSSSSRAAAGHHLYHEPDPLFGSVVAGGRSSNAHRSASFTYDPHEHQSPPKKHRHSYYHRGEVTFLRRRCRSHLLPPTRRGGSAITRSRSYSPQPTPPSFDIFDLNMSTSDDAGERFHHSMPNVHRSSDQLDRLAWEEEEFHRSLPNMSYEEDGADPFELERTDPFAYGRDDSFAYERTEPFSHEGVSSMGGSSCLEFPERAVAPSFGTLSNDMEPIPFEMIEQQQREQRERKCAPAAYEGRAEKGEVEKGGVSKDFVACLEKLTTESTIEEGNVFEPIPFSSRGRAKSENPAIENKEEEEEDAQFASMDDESITSAAPEVA